MKNTFSKKAVTALAVGTIMTLGAAFPTFVQAADFNTDSPGFHLRHHNPSPEMAKQLGLSMTDFEKYKAKGYSHRDVVHAAFLAKASGKTIDKVLSYKTEDTTWKYVTKKLGVTTEELKNTRQDMMAERIATKTGSEKADILNLFNQGYRSRDIMMAGELAKHSSKPMSEILDMKKINNNWRDVASSLGVSQNTIRQDFRANYRHTEQ